MKFTSVEYDDWNRAKRASSRQPALGEVYFFGDSQVEFGIALKSVQERLGLRCYSLAFRGGQAPASYFLLERMLRSGVKPKAVVVDFEPNLLTIDRRYNRSLWSAVTDFEQSLRLAWPKFDSDLVAENLVNSILPSVRNRHQIRQNILGAFQGQTSLNSINLEIVHRNQTINQGGILMGIPAVSSSYDFWQWDNYPANSWKPEAVNNLFAEKFIKLADQHKIPVYCILMPVVPGLQQKAESSGMEQCYRNWLKRFQARYSNLVILDCHHSDYQLPTFFDELHLNKMGAVSVGLALGDYLKVDLKRSGDRPRWVEMPRFRFDQSVTSLEDHQMSAMIVHNQSGRIRENGPAQPLIAVDPSRQSR